MQKILEIDGLKTYFFTDSGVVRAVDDVGLDVQEGSVVGVVGESGCGKTVMARSILNIIEKGGRIVSGRIVYHKGAETVDIASLKPTGAAIKRIRGREIAMIFQEPMTSFSPVYTIGNQIMEMLMVHRRLGATEARRMATEMLTRVGMSKPEQRIDEYPHQLSGGMRQRAMIAMALSCDPRLLIADEPTTALDVTIQSQIIELLKRLQQELSTSIIMITHDLGVIAEIADEVVVMYLGKVVEQAPVRKLFRDPLHPYTSALLRSIPRLGRKVEGRLPSIKGTIPDVRDLPPGCYFHPRCESFIPGVCDAALPELRAADDDHRARCVLVNGVNADD